MKNNPKQETPLHFKIIGGVIVVVFSLAAIYFGHLFITTLAATEKARNWQATPAKVVEYSLVTSSPDVNMDHKDPKQRINAKYDYMYDGKPYQGTEVDFTRGHSDNFSQERRYQQMKILEKKDITVYVNPANPEESVVDRSLPAEKMLFSVVFFLFPCGLGTLVMVFGALYPIKPLYRYAAHIWGLLHGLPALWLMLFYSDLYGWKGLMLLGLLSALVPVSVYRAVKVTLSPPPQEPEAKA